MTTDNRTNEPNKYAGFLARQEHQRDPWRGVGVKCLCGKLFDLDADHAMHQVDEILRAALVAAAGAAPQAPAINANCMVDADGCEAGTGEPNDNREALKTALYVGLGGLVGSYIPAYKAEQAVNEILSALSRATVPDAATDAGRWHLLYEKGVEERVELRAERDAAVAAIERVRDTHQPCLGCETAHCFPCYSDWPCPTVGALDGAPEPSLSESERLEIDGTPYVFSPDSLSYQIDGWVHDLGLPGDSMLREFGVQDGSYFEDPTVLSEKLQEVTIAWLEEHGYRRDGAPEPEVVEWAYAVGHRNSDGSYSSEADYDDDEITDDIDEARAWVDEARAWVDEARAWVDEALDGGTHSNAILVKRAPMPSWLPVEGESKP